MSASDGPIGPVAPTDRYGAYRQQPHERAPDDEQPPPRRSPSPGFDAALEAASTPRPVAEVDPLAALEQLTELHLREKGLRAASERRRSVVQQSLIDFLS